MKTPLAAIIPSLFFRLIASLIFSSPKTHSTHHHYDPRDNDHVLNQIGGPGLLPAIRAAVLDPVHSWDHLEEACFWREHGPSVWVNVGEIGGVFGGGNKNGDTVGNFAGIYAPGTRVVSPPLVVAFLGETLVCPGIPISKSFLWIIQQILLLVADIIGAWGIYQLGKRIIYLQGQTEEAEMEKQTRQSERDENDANVVKCNDDCGNENKVDGTKPLVIPGMLRPERGWIFGFSSKVIDPNRDKTKNNDDANREKNENYSTTQQNEKECINTHQSEQLNGTTMNHDVDNTNSLSLRYQNKVKREAIISPQQLPLLAAMLYFFNPISAIANATGSLRGIWDALLLVSLHYAIMPSTSVTSEGIPIKVPSASKSALCLALATYVDAAYAVFITPILLWRGLFFTPPSTTSTQKGVHRDWKAFIGLYTFYLGCLHILASKLVGGDWDTYRKVMLQSTLPNIAFLEQDGSGSYPGPNMGLHWYFFVQMFDRFRPYFVVFVNGVPVMFVVPLLIRLHQYPAVLVTSFQLLWAIFRPVNTVHTLTLALSFVLLNPRTLVRMRNPSLVSIFALPVPILLFVTFHRMWLVTGNGNPNYIYFQCVAYSVFVSLITIEFVGASVKRDKVRRMVEKGDTIKKFEPKADPDKNVNGGNINSKKDEVTETNAAENNHETEDNFASNHEEKESSDQECAADEPGPNVVFL